ncbi:type VII secretion system-associated protein [Streptomyces sp. NBC_00582]|uniref:type VII secretion system-associated protein n=1 Tax=Streptomyces sp. NBC_00582 TaxID=2975783 RepID=UPI002E7FF661|nr:type VII secretion system-associated protein [Streptomyces sp. NBC_00582]WUB64532.1 type VII secretion system-associated protein [Streptomyces sp. NBC_00582]
MNEAQASVPPVTDAVRAQAAARPGGWVYAVDPYFDPDGKVPPIAIVGAWKVDANGQLNGEFKHNPKYRPSPSAVGMPAPSDRVDEAMQLAATGYGSDGAVRAALMNSTVYLAPGAELRTAPPASAAGEPVIALYTHPSHAPTSSPQLQQVHFADLLPRLPVRGAVELNGNSAVSVRIPLADMRRETGQ